LFQKYWVIKKKEREVHPSQHLYLEGVEDLYVYNVPKFLERYSGKLSTMSGEPGTWDFVLLLNIEAFSLQVCQRLIDPLCSAIEVLAAVKLSKVSSNTLRKQEATKTVGDCCSQLQ